LNRSFYERYWHPEC